jgi:hypothetical protein
MESIDDCFNEGRDNLDDIELQNLETDSVPRASTPASGDPEGYRGTSAFPFTQRMDTTTNLHTLPSKDAGRSFIALPNVFDGRKENYRRFRRQFGLFLMAN